MESGKWKGKKRVPELRFPEFEGEWEEKKLGEILEFKNGINASAEKYGTGIKFINVLDILENRYITYDNIIGKVSINNKKLKDNEVNYGDILFQRSSETREEVGMSNIYLDYKIATFGGFVIRGKKISEYNPIFMNYVLRTDSIRKQMERSAGGSTRFNIGQNELKNIKYTTPSLLEQEKIGDFFYKIDKKLELQQERIEALKEYKKGMMQKIFSQEIRFKDDNGKDYPEWEEKRLGEVAEITTGKLDANAMVSNGKYRFYTCAKEYYKIDKYAFDTEALLISGNGANVGYIHYYNGKFNAYQRTYVLDKFKEEIIYIKYYLDVNLKIRIERTKNAGNTPYITLSTLTNMKINLPSLPEQTKIANFLSSLDKKIELEEEKLENFKQFKKGLMQKMFI